MFKQRAEGEVISEEFLLETLARPFLPPDTEQRDLAENVLYSIGETLASMKGGEEEGISKTLVLLDAHANKTKNPLLQLQGTAVLLTPENRSSPLRRVLSTSGLARLFNKLVWRHLVSVRNELYTSKGNHGINLEDANRFAEKGDEAYAEYVRLINLLEELQYLI